MDGRHSGLSGVSGLNKKLVLVGVLCICLCLSGAGWSAPDPNPFLERINQVARDVHATEKMVSSEGRKSEATVAALARESASAQGLTRYLSTLSSADEAENALDTIRQFGYRVTNRAEKKACQISLSLLEQRLKYLAQTEDPSLTSFLEKINSLSSELESKQVRFEAVPGSRVRQLADQGSRTGSSKEDRLLGANVAGGKTSFSVYSPRAVEVNVVLFKNQADKTGRGYPLKKDPNGVWSVTIDGELYRAWYAFSANGPVTEGYLFEPRRLLSDPYAFANYDHDGKSLVVKRDFTWSDRGFKTPSMADLIVYEMHVKDFTAHTSSGVAGPAKGGYLGLLEGKGTDKVLGHLVDLGVNAVELLPCHEFDNNFAGHPNHWGYMTSHFFAPECSYATGKNGEAVKEFKLMVNGLHKSGLAVIMDVVFNHTAEGNEKGVPINFKGLDNPGYYRLMDDKKLYWNGTGVGNEFRSDNPMARKLILDSLKFWVREYHVDGFRFDLGTILDKQTMTAIAAELPADTVLIAEPWAADWSRNQWGKTDFRNTKWAKWNDDFREKVRGLMRGEVDRNDLMTVLAGSCFWWTAKPTESVNYIECHDGATVCDLFKGNKSKIKLGAAALLTGQGVPMIHEGQEFMKSKNGNDNSYDQDNEINWINWSVKRANKDIFDFYKGLIGLRRKYENFKHATALNNQSISWIQPANQRALGYLLKGKTDFLVLLNGDEREWINFPLPGGIDWVVVCNGDKVDDTGTLGTAKGDYKVPPCTAVILKNR